MLNQKAQKCVLVKSTHTPKDHTDHHEEQIKLHRSQDYRQCNWRQRTLWTSNCCKQKNKHQFPAELPSEHPLKATRESSGGNQGSTEAVWKRGRENKEKSLLESPPWGKKKGTEENPERWEHWLQRKELEVHRPPNGSPERQHFWGRRG